MVKKFRRRKNNYTLSSSPLKTNTKLSAQEKKTYQTLFISAITLIIFASLVYLKGIDFITFYSSFWRTEDISPTPSPIVTNIHVPSLDILPSAIKEDSPLRISGSCSAGYQISILINGQEIKSVLTDKNGRFEAILSEELTQEEENHISAYSVDLDGYKSNPSASQTVLVDTKAPELTVSYPSNGAEIVQETNVIEIVGETESTKITVFVNGFRAILDLEGGFTYALSLSEGENTIEVIARDPVGHETKENLTVTYSSSETETPSENTEES